MSQAKSFGLINLLGAVLFILAEKVTVLFVVHD